ncbi:hypothetical protein [Massilia sp. DD77]|uniref:hypothetical protein n=1 Tax=Massilia sp. DD77 TaxID=3109349 RepID=UPI002FFE4EDB
MQYDFQVTAGGAQRIEATGRFFKYISGIGRVRVTTSKGRVIDLIPGQGVWGEEFTGLSVKDLSGAGNVGVILAGDFDFRDDTMYAGEGTFKTNSDYSTITEGGNCYVGGTRLGAGVGAGYMVFGGLANPASAVSTAYVEQLNVAVINAAGAIIASEVNICIAQWEGDPDLVNFPWFGSLKKPLNKKPGGPVAGAGFGWANIVKSGAETSLQAITRILGADVGASVLTIPTMTGALRVEVPLPQPLAVPPGYALFFLAKDGEDCWPFLNMREA